MVAKSAEIVRLLPELRQFAGALCGSTERGDTLVEVTVELLLSRQAELDEAHLRRSLFRLFDQVHRRLHPDEQVARPTGRDDRLRDAISRLPVLDRKVLLLSLIAGFEHRDSGLILDLPAADVSARLLAARERIRRFLSARVLVIEDEPIVAMSIAHILSRMGHKVCGVAQTRKEALASMREARPTLILADIRLRDGDDGIETVDEILGENEVPVIFITGYAHELITQARMRPSIVIGKPFMPQTLEVAVQRVLAGPVPA